MCVRGHRHTRMHACMHAHRQLYTAGRIDELFFRPTPEVQCTHTHTHIHTHTHTHTHTFVPALGLKARTHHGDSGSGTVPVFV